MTKKRSIVKLCIITVLTLIGLFLTFFSFVIPTTNTTFKGFFNAINYGYDINGGVLAVYEPLDDTLTGQDLENKVNQTVAKLNSALGGLGFNITKQENNIRLEISNTSYKELTNKYSAYGIDILELLGTNKGITFSNKSSEAEAEGFVSGEYIDNCTYGYSNSWYITVNFTEEGKTKFKELTKDIANGEGDGKLYVFIDGELYNSEGFDITSAVSSLTLSATNQQAAEALSVQFSVLGKPMLLNQVINDTISGGLNSSTGAFFGNQSTLSIVALCIILIATFVFFCVRYRILGVLASLATLIFVVIYSFLLQSIPLVLMDINGILGVYVVLGMLIASIVAIFEQIRKEYSAGKKIPNSVTSGFKKNVLTVLEKYVFVLLLSAVFYIVGFTPLKTIAVNVFVGLFVNYFTLFVVLRGLCKIYLPINSTNKKLYNLKREGLKNEI